MKRIISASYKDDTPAFKSEEFFNDLKRGFREIPSKFGIQRISLKPEDVYCFVFWTKNPSDHFIAHMADIKSPFYIQWSITGYDQDIEANLPSKKDVMNKFIAISKMLGKERTVWRYDPILISGKYTVQEHILRFRNMCDKLKEYTTHCVISFMDEYGKILDKVYAGEMRAPSLNEVQTISKAFGEIAKEAGITIQTCSEGQYDLSAYGIHEGPCIDPELVEKLSGETLPDKVKTPNSFRRCRCAVNTDIGSYHTCKHGCKYCYAQ